MAKDNTSCSFCGREREETDILIAGISGHICNFCINQATDIVKQEIKDEEKEKKEKAG